MELTYSIAPNVVWHGRPMVIILNRGRENVAVRKCDLNEIRKVVKRWRRAGAARIERFGSLQSLIERMDWLKLTSYDPWGLED